MIRILCICRLYTGFEESLNTKKWAPKGAPTIAKVIEHLDKNNDFDLNLVFTCKDYNSEWKTKKDQAIVMDGLQSPALVLAGQKRFPKWLWKFREKISDLRQLWKLWQIYKETKPDLIYCDRVNLFPAAVFARFTKTPVIWRVMGVLEQMHSVLRCKNLRSTWIKYLYKSPFKAVICTLEGSGGGPWMDKALNRKTKKHLLINGVDFDVEPMPVADIPEDKIKVLFVGRLETIKGVKEFIEAFVGALKENAKLHAILVGDGSLKESLQAEVKNSGLENSITFLGSLKPEQLKYVRQNCTLYVSLNKQGNLSNVNLEALSDGLLTIIPESQPDLGIDIDTDNIIPKDVFIRFGAIGETKKLEETILKFSDKDKRHLHIEQAKKLAKTLLPTWEDRVQREIEIYKSILPSETKRS